MITAGWTGTIDGDMGNLGNYQDVDTGVAPTNWPDIVYCADGFYPIVNSPSSGTYHGEASDSGSGAWNIFDHPPTAGTIIGDVTLSANDALISSSDLYVQGNMTFTGDGVFNSPVINISGNVTVGNATVTSPYIVATNGLWTINQGRTESLYGVGGSGRFNGIVDMIDGSSSIANSSCNWLVIRGQGTIAGFIDAPAITFNYDDSPAQFSPSSVDPGVENVWQGINYSINGENLSGTFNATLLDVEDVRAGTQYIYGQNTYTGTLSVGTGTGEDMQESMDEVLVTLSPGGSTSATFNPDKIPEGVNICVSGGTGTGKLSFSLTKFASANDSVGTLLSQAFSMGQYLTSGQYPVPAGTRATFFVPLMVGTRTEPIDRVIATIEVGGGSVTGSKFNMTA